MIESLLIKRFTTTVGNNCVRLKEKTHSFFGARKTINNTTIHGWVSAEKSTFLSPWFIIGHTDVHLNTFSNTRQIYHKMILLMTFRVVELLGNWPVNKYCVDSVIFFFRLVSLLRWEHGGPVCGGVRKHRSCTEQQVQFLWGITGWSGWNRKCSLRFWRIM